MTTAILCVILTISLAASAKLTANWMSRIEGEIEGIKAVAAAVAYLLRNATVKTDVFPDNGNANEFVKSVNDLLDNDTVKEKDNEQGEDL